MPEQNLKSKSQTKQGLSEEVTEIFKNGRERRIFRRQVFQGRVGGSKEPKELECTGNGHVNPTRIQARVRDLLDERSNLKRNVSRARTHFPYVNGLLLQGKN